MAVNSAPTNFLDTSISTGGHILAQQSEDIERYQNLKLESEKGLELQEVEYPAGTGKEHGTIKSAYASWSQAALMRKFWKMYLLGVLVAQAGM